MLREKIASFLGIDISDCTVRIFGYPIKQFSGLEVAEVGAFGALTIVVGASACSIFHIAAWISAVWVTQALQPIPRDRVLVAAPNRDDDRNTALV